MRVFFKVTAWECVEVSEEKYLEVISGVENLSIETADELVELFPEDTTYKGIDLGTSNQMSLDENEYAPTIEMWDTEHNIIFDNGIKL